MAAGLLMAATPARSATADYPKREFWLGYGYTKTYEQSLFNVPGDVPSDPAGGVLSLGYARNFNAHRRWAFTCTERSRSRARSAFLARAVRRPWISP